MNRKFKKDKLLHEAKEKYRLLRKMIKMNENFNTTYSSGQVSAIDFFKETKEEVQKVKRKIDWILWIQLIMLILTILMVLKMYFIHFLT